MREGQVGGESSTARTNSLSASCESLSAILCLGGDFKSGITKPNSSLTTM